MQIIFDLFNLIFFGPTVNLLVFILRILEASNIPGALGIAIVILTVLVRLLVWPFMSSQMRSAKRIADLRPQINELKEKHKDDKQALAKAQMELYKAEGVNPAGGCLPVLIQIPILIALYQAIFAFFGGPQGLEQLNKVLYVDSWRLDSPPDPNFLGVNLASKPAEFTTLGAGLLLIPVLTSLIQFLLSKMMTPQTLKTYPSDSPKEKKEKSDTEDAMQAVQSQMTYLMPIMIGYFAFSLPIAISIYWNVLNIVSMVQQYKIAGLGGLESFLRLKKG